MEISRTNTKKRDAPKRKTSPRTDYVSKMTVTVSRDGEISRHDLYFDDNPITVREMFSVGFLGDLEFRHPHGVVEKAELEATPAGEIEGDTIGRLTFQIRMLTMGSAQNAHVVKFRYMTYLN